MVAERPSSVRVNGQRSIYKEMLILGLLRYHFFACGACNANVTVGYLTYSLVFLFWGARGPGSQNRRGGGTDRDINSRILPLRPSLMPIWRERLAHRVRVFVHSCTDRHAYHSKPASFVYLSLATAVHVPEAR